MSKLDFFFGMKKKVGRDVRFFKEAGGSTVFLEPKDLDFSEEGKAMEATNGTWVLTGCVASRCFPS